ncbi:hypothetical protein MSPP1_003392 [Malassezia sp. CBS 17886]|nr:hypothetical protein MSPP1_003392 [Malassezia sp. CBS 17886]
MSDQSVQLNTLSPLNVFWLIHVALELPMGIFGFFSPSSIPFVEITPATALVMKLLASFLVASSVGALLCYGLPDYLPGKRAFAVQLLIAHTIIAVLFFYVDRSLFNYQYPAVVVHAIPAVEKIPIVTLACIMHAVVAVLVVAWYATLPAVRVVTARLKSQ